MTQNPVTSDSVLEESTRLEWGVAATFRDLPFGQEEWDAAVERLAGSVYMTWDWLRTWLSFYGRGCGLHLFWFRSRGEVVGLLPIYVQNVGPRTLSVRVARLVGANIPPKVFNPPVDVEIAKQCMAITVEWLIRSGVDVCSIGPISEVHPPWSQWASGGQNHRLWKCRQVGVHSLFELSATLDEYMARLGKNEQKNRRKYELRMLRKEYPVRLIIHRDPGSELQGAFDRFVELHTRQWVAEGLPGHFGAWPRGREYNAALAQSQAVQGRTRLLEIWAGEEYICGQYAFAWGDKWYWELPARALGPVWDRFSLGPSGLMVLLAEAIREGCGQVEGGLGHYEYKLRLGAREHPVWILEATGGRRGAAMRRLIAKCIQSFLRWGYHKLWYRRIQPRLPERWKRPQWNLWLAYDY